DRLGGRYTVEAYKDTPGASNGLDNRVLFADFDGSARLNQGRLDQARVDLDGSLHYMRNQSALRNWIRVQLKGVRSLKLAQDALVEIKAGTLYQRQFYNGVPLLFATGDNATADNASVDVVRITWPNGLIQNEVRQPANQTHAFEEAQRLSGSCPMIWSWNGREFQFITDVLGVAPLGASDGEGRYFPVDHDEFVTIPGAALSAVNGQYDV